ncbi:tRNA (guanosine(37)-N1)-methyltransferase TrmD [Cryobacterium gelidum]|uniref:tRNA (guanine-N(1)-)-methyltransferase n=1 Tax=Cryobacterium gelidum TaxID=1259164 RepID=A0A4R9B0J2_9MICO|nr:tRNA (guanosine(37)-N1)-methyltransferase TrmD [Cryobacterium gelidum]TFD73552.1 tRNA (guanosine(37)-N1)-methyltransferase TrmD [Cryobacterium gelidum]
MRIDIVTIFPEFFDVLDLSLLGKARQSGLIELGVHNLRDHTHDRHHSVDDTPYGGGAGMVMKPEPWGDALDSILGDGAGARTTDGAGTTDGGVTHEDGPILIFPSPAGDQFSQAMARELSLEKHLVFGCGRYEGIDQRVVDHYEARGRVRLVSLGDYVLNGGEVAVMAMIEAIGRLIPGVVGNPESLVEESHEDGLLEYPSYTKPASWRGLDVPPVLLSGNHGAISTWRRQQQIERTERVRPDLVTPHLLPPANAKTTTSPRR